MRALAFAAACLFLTVAGCTSPINDNGTATLPTSLPHVEAMTFKSFVLPAVHQGHGLYEPTIDVSPSGVIYVSAHSTGVDVNAGAPTYFSKDDGKTWQQLPFAASAALPAAQQGGTPPPSDEIFIVAGDDGTAWGVDVSLGTFPVHGWCDDGARNCYYNANGYNRADATTQQCGSTNLNDRPWAAFANGTLLMVNNPGGGPVQIGVLKVPPADPVGVANPVTGPSWNTCAGDGQEHGGGIPGIPGMRNDLFFAVPQVLGDLVSEKGGPEMVVVTGHAGDIMHVEEHPVLKHHHDAVSAIMDSGQAAFDAEGTLYVAEMNNNGSKDGGFRIAVSTDDARNFTVQRFPTAGPLDSLYIDGNSKGAGLLVNWGVVNGTKTDYFFGHLSLEGGTVVMRDVNVAVHAGPRASRHVQGAALGPDGRAYMIMSEVSGNDDAGSVQQIGITPLTVVVQQDGPRLGGVAAAGVAG